MGGWGSVFEGPAYSHDTAWKSRIPLFLFTWRRRRGEGRVSHCRAPMDSSIFPSAPLSCSFDTSLPPPIHLSPMNTRGTCVHVWRQRGWRRLTSAQPKVNPQVSRSSTLQSSQVCFHLDVQFGDSGSTPRTPERGHHIQDLCQVVPAPVERTTVPFLVQCSRLPACDVTARASVLHT